MNLHHIPGLAECYLYLNDDFLFARRSAPEDFWARSEAWPFSMTNYRQAPLSPHGQDEWGTKLFHVARTLQRKTNSGRRAGSDGEGLLLVGHHGHFFIKSEVAKVRRRVSSATRYRAAASLSPCSNNACFHAPLPRRPTRSRASSRRSSGRRALLDGGRPAACGSPSYSLTGCAGSTAPRAAGSARSTMVSRRRAARSPLTTPLAGSVPSRRHGRGRASTTSCATPRSSRRSSGR